MPYNPVELIWRKRSGQALSGKEIQYLVDGYTRGRIPDYQFSAFLMTVYFRSLSMREIVALTRALLRSGRSLNLRGFNRPVIDKHSTGGVGDKISLILAPLIAACGVVVPMISGRSLGHTGGTLDKLQSIPGFRVDLTLQEFKSQLRKIGVAMIGATDEIAPADRLIYALRDVTATVDSIPLIAASIMSKKLAEDLDGLVLDVKYGSGAFLPEYRRAKYLARIMVDLGRRFGVRVRAVMTDMDCPLGRYVGNALEVMEAIEVLKGRGTPDLIRVTFALGEVMLQMARIKGGQKLLAEKIASGAALKKFREIIRGQGGDDRVIDDYRRLPLSRRGWPLRSREKGYIGAIDSHRLGLLATELGAGRRRKEDALDPSCGFRLYKKTGDFVTPGEILIEILSDDARRAALVRSKLPDVYNIKHHPMRRRPLIRETI